MQKEPYGGDERRTATRREEDRGHCAVHYLLQEETKDHRAIVCGKIREVKDMHATLQADIKQMVPWRAFTLAVSIAAIVGAGSLGWLSSSMNANHQDTKQSLNTIHRRVTDTNEDYEKIKEAIMNLQYMQNAVANRLLAVEKQLEKK